MRTLNDCRRLVGQVCMDGPEGIVQTHPIPNTFGKVTAIATDWGTQYSRYSHLPLFNVDSLYGLTIAWPSCVSTGSHPTPGAKIVMMGGHVGLLDEEITVDQCEWMTPRVYPIGIVRHILRAPRNQFQSNSPYASVLGRAG